MKQNKKWINRTGLENLLLRGNKIVQVDGIDMDRAWGRIVKRGETVSAIDGSVSEPVYGKEIIVWLPDIETAEDIEEIMARDGICEIIVDAPITQPNGRMNAFINAVLG